MTWQACVRGCSDFYPAADVSHGRGHIRIQVRMIPFHRQCILTSTLLPSPAIEARNSERERSWI